MAWSRGAAIFCLCMVLLYHGQGEAKHRLSTTIAALKAEKKLAIPPDSLSECAEIARQGRLDIKRYAWYVRTLLSHKIAPHEAIKRAVARQKYDRWAAKRTQHVIKKDPDNFVSKVHGLKISSGYQERLIRTFSLCIDSYRSEKNRAHMRKITIEDKIPGYGKPPQDHFPASPMDGVSNKKSNKPMYQAYSLLIEAAKTIVEEQQLDDWNKACLAKCVGDEIVQYSPASQHPLRAIRLYLNSMFLDGATNLSSEYGICTTYASITKAIAQDLGFGQRVRIGQVGKHYFNQINIDGKWYHFHPLRKYGKDCSFFPY